MRKLANEDKPQVVTAWKLRYQLKKYAFLYRIGIGGRAEWTHLVDNSNISMRDRVEIQFTLLSTFSHQVNFLTNR